MLPMFSWGMHTSWEELPHHKQALLLRALSQLTAHPSTFSLPLAAPCREPTHPWAPLGEARHDFSPWHAGEMCHQIHRYTAALRLLTLG